MEPGLSAGGQREGMGAKGGRMGAGLGLGASGLQLRDSVQHSGEGRGARRNGALRWGGQRGPPGTHQDLTLMAREMEGGSGRRGQKEGERGGERSGKHGNGGREAEKQQKKK